MFEKIRCQFYYLHFMSTKVKRKLIRRLKALWHQIFKGAKKAKDITYCAICEKEQIVTVILDKNGDYLYISHPILPICKKCFEHYDNSMKEMRKYFKSLSQEERT